MKAPADERGAALLTVLLLVAVMAAVSATALDRLALATRLTGNASLASQGRQWLGMAEQLTAVRLEQLLAGDPRKTTLAGDWHGTPRTVDLPDGGRVTATVTDAGNCFNLNSLVARTGEGLLIVQPSAVAQFAALMTSLGVEPGRATGIAAAAADWIDSDGAMLPGGAEDGRHAPNRAMAHESEFTRVAGVTTETAVMLRPWTCALPLHQPSEINVNTLTPEQAPLLAMLAPERLAVGRARAVLAQRPAGGFANADEFWRSPLLRNVTTGPDAAQQVAVRSRWFLLKAQASGGGQSIGERALLGERDGKVVLLRREWTSGE